ncbi:MAG: PfaD family polyunsaturated fatty acid/polyketide biosynthesis protein [Myxococcales bacterium]|nr:PfaD family polyunsaturated fatty acid/polyketide biosynthesis protein [Myxococcales bacterium]
MAMWTSTSHSPAFEPADLAAAARHFREPVYVVRDGERGPLGVARGGQPRTRGDVNGAPAYPLVAAVPPIYPEWLGDRSFTEVHGLRFPYVSGAMANGIATTDLVICMARAGMLGFFGAAGLTVDRIEQALDRIEDALGGTGLSWGSNLIHAPNEPQVEMGTVELYLRRGVRRVSASAYMGLNPMIVRYAYTGLRRLPDGSVHRRNFVFCKISRPEVARRFLAPAPAEIIDGLVADGHLTAEEAELGRSLPVAEDVIVESDSGGHTDNQALTALFPTILAVRDELATAHGYTRPIRIGAAGGIGTPAAVAAAFQLGAAFVLTGSVNQAALQSGLSPIGKKLLCQAGLADVAMAPAADMFELGVEVQVLKRGTMFGVRAKRLYEAYHAYDGIEHIPADVRAKLEREIFKDDLENIWAGCEAFFAKRDPHELQRAKQEPKHRMALVFRWYLGLSSKWAIAGEADRGMDYQIWCGPAMGAFNAWVAGSFLEPPESRDAVQIARNLLEGAAAITRAQQLRAFGVPMPSDAFTFAPRPLEA